MQESESNPNFHSSSKWENLGSDITELILSFLPILSIIRSSSVCKHWNSIINSRSFKTRISNSKKNPWLFLFTQIRDSPIKNQAFGFDPESHAWIKLPPTLAPFPNDWTIGSHGFLFNRQEFSFFSVSSGLRSRSSPVRFYSFNPLIGSFNKNPSEWRFIVVGRAKPMNGRFHQYDCLTVEIYDPNQDSWESYPRLPEIFRSGLSPPPRLSSAMLRNKFYVSGIYSGFLISFDWDKCCWNDVRTLRPPGLVLAFLMSCLNNLILAGLCRINDEIKFYVWRVDEETLEFGEVGIMPWDMVSCLLDSDDRYGNNLDRLKRSLKCVGVGNMVYVLSRIHDGVYYTCCLCEISDSFGECRWKRMPDFYLPEPVDSVHTVISLCSNASLQDFLGNENVVP